MANPTYNGEVNILTSTVVYDNERQAPVRYLFGVKKMGDEYRPTIEKRDANTGEFITDYTTMDTATILTQLQIGNYIFVPHTNTASDFVNNSLALEYIGE